MTHWEATNFVDYSKYMQPDFVICEFFGFLTLPSGRDMPEVSNSVGGVDCTAALSRNAQRPIFNFWIKEKWMITHCKTHWMSAEIYLTFAWWAYIDK